MTVFRCMVVLAACVNLQAGSSLTADRILREHTLYCSFHCEFRTLSHQGTILNFLQTADPAGMSAIVLLIQLLTGEDCLLCIDDDNEIASVYVGSELSLVLAAKESCNYGSGTTQRLVCCVYYIPLAVNVFRFCHISGHDLTSDLYV